MANVIVRPLITESSMISAQTGKYTFIIAKSASKEDVKRAVEKHFNVHVTSITVRVVKGKTHRVGPRRNEVDKPITKKATVTVQKGEKIGLFEAVA